MKEIDFTAVVHLPFDELELGDLAFGLTVRPCGGACCTNGIGVAGDAGGYGGDEAGATFLDLGDKVSFGFAPDHRVESLDERAGVDQ